MSVSGIVVNGSEITGTTKELAERMGVDYTTANAFMKLLIARGIAKKAGVRPSERGYGKGSDLYTLPTTPITLSLFPNPSVSAG